MTLEPHETLFEAGDAADSGIYIVVEGALGVFLAGADGASRHTNTLHPGESVGDLDVLDGEPSFHHCCCASLHHNMTPASEAVPVRLFWQPLWQMYEKPTVCI